LRLNKWPCCQIYPFQNLEEIIESSKTLNPIESEGYVICDKNYNRVKVKAPQYVALAHLQERDSTGVNYKKMMQIIRMHEGSEFLTYYPQHDRLHQIIHDIYKSMKKKLKEIDSAISLDIIKFSTSFLREIITEHYPEASEFFFRAMKDIYDAKYESIDDYLKSAELMDVVELSSQFISSSNQELLDELSYSVPKRKKKKKKKKNNKLVDSQELQHN